MDPAEAMLAIDFGTATSTWCWSTTSAGARSTRRWPRSARPGSFPRHWPTAATARHRAAVDDLAAACAGLERNVLPLAELTVIRACYDQRLECTPADAADALRLLGEHGGSVAARLGRPAGTPGAELAARARARRRYWQQEEATGAYSGPTRRAAQVVLRRCVELEREAGRAGPA
jgi:hypothetical protein